MTKGSISSPSKGGGTHHLSKKSSCNGHGHSAKVKDDDTENTREESLSSSACYEPGEGSESSDLSGSDRSRGKGGKSSRKSKESKGKDKHKSSHSNHGDNNKKEKEHNHHSHKKDKDQKEKQHSDHKKNSHHSHHNHEHSKKDTATTKESSEPDFHWEETYHWEKHKSSEQRRSIKTEKRFQKLVNDDNDNGDLFYAANQEDVVTDPYFSSTYKQPQQQAPPAASFVEEDDDWDEEEQDKEEDEALRTTVGRAHETNTSPTDSSSPRRQSLKDRLTGSNLSTSAPNGANPSFIPAYLVDKARDEDYDEEDEEALAEQVIQNPGQAYAPHSPKNRGHHGNASPFGAAGISPPFAEKITIGPEVLGDEEFTVPEALGMDEAIPEINHQRYTALL